MIRLLAEIPPAAILAFSSWFDAAAANGPGKVTNVV
jgi:hypothetical protein